jgi:hypothetical protein
MTEKEIVRRPSENNYSGFSMHVLVVYPKKIENDLIHTGFITHQVT